MLCVLSTCSVTGQNAQLHEEFLRADTINYSRLEDYLPILSLKKDWINIFRFSRNAMDPTKSIVCGLVTNDFHYFTSFYVGQFLL